MDDPGFHLCNTSIESTLVLNQPLGMINANRTKGWNRAPEWTVYFCGYFDVDSTYATFLGNGNTNSALVEYPAGDTVTSASRLGVVYTFKATEVTSRVGVSFISTEQACENANTQIPAGTTLETLKSAAKDAWNTQVLSKVTTTDTSSTANLQLLYSSLYHMHLIPTNKTGENPLWTSSEPYYDDIFTLWDLVSYRSREEHKYHN